MSVFTRRDLLMLASLAPAGRAAAQLIGHSDGEWTIRGTDPIEFYRGDRRVTAYHSGMDAGLPYFDPIVGPSGKSFTAAAAPADPSATRDAATIPSGLWFSLGNVNGCDFHPISPDADTNGKKRGRIIHRGMNGVLIKGSAIVIRVKSEWMERDLPERRLCSDQREFTLFHREDGALVISAVIELMADAGDLEIGPEETGAWSMRLGPGLVWSEDDKNRRLTNSEGLAGSETIGSRADWLTCQGLDAGNLPGGVAILDHPENPGFPARWTVADPGLVSANPFAPRPAAAVGLPGEAGGGEPGTKGPTFRLRARAGQQDVPRTVRNGESVVFRYRTIFFSGKAEAAQVPQAFDRFAE